MSRHFPSNDPFTLTITTATLASDVLDSMSNTQAIALHNISTSTGTITVQVSWSATATTTNAFQNLQSPAGTDVTLGSTAAIVITDTPFRRLRLISSTQTEGNLGFRVNRHVFP